MNLTIGFIILFLVLFLPGIIFRRFYYLGEFSKQIVPDEHILRTLTFAIIPSAALQVLGIIFYNNFFDQTIDLSKVILFYKDLVGENSLSNDSLEILGNESVTAFFFYQGGIYIAAFLLAGLSYFLVRKLGLDTRMKLLRFKNQWAYIFSAEILKFEKFRGNHSLPSSKFLISYVDVLVRKNENETELYSGYLTDYDLDPKNINEIDRLYLTETKRFKKDKKKVIAKSIPGQFFVVLGKDILNINVNYIFNKKAQEDSQKIYKAILVVYNVLLLSFILLSFPIIIFNLDFLVIYPEALSEKHWLARIGIWLIFNQSYSILFPFKLESDTRDYKLIGRKEFKKNSFASIIVIAIIGVLLWWLS